MKELIIILIIAAILLLVGAVAILIIVKLELVEKTHVQKWAEVTISWLTFAALVCAGVFGFFKYDDYRKENNYQKVMTRYMDNNIEVVFSALNFGVNSARVDFSTRNMNLSVHERRELIEKNNEHFKKLAALAPKLTVFDPILFRTLCESVINGLASGVNNFSDEVISAEQAKAIITHMNVLETFSNFITFNLQDIGELIRKDPRGYNTPTLDVVKKKDEYQEIINRFKKFDELEGKEKFKYAVNYLQEKGILKKINDKSLQVTNQ